LLFGEVTIIWNISVNYPISITCKLPYRWIAAISITPGGKFRPGDMVNEVKMPISCHKAFLHPNPFEVDSEKPRFEVYTTS
jgi:hypothetical protein